jgi:tetratricopeptide (TPR) repeat protein
MKIQLLLLGILIWGVLNVNAQKKNPDEDQGTVSEDSLLEQYSVDELITFKKYYKDKLKTLEVDKSQLRQVTVHDAESFIEQHPESKILDKVYMRLAELYYTKSIETYLVADQEYDKLLSDFEKGVIKQEPVAPKKDFSKCLALLDKIRTQFPNSPLTDDVIYNVGFIKEEEGEIQEALAIYQKVIDEYPDSRYVPEAYIRIAEYFFNPPQNNIEKAIELFKEVLSFKDSPRYDEALYRLGWSYYRLNMYPEAVAYFTLLADDIERSKSLDPNQKYTNPALRDESVEYIGISFLDYGGVEGAAAYLKDIGGRDYGVEVLQKIGDVYMKEKEEYEKAIQAYQTLLTVYPDAEKAPVIQSKIVQGYRYLENDMMAYLARKAMFTNYRPESEWWNKTESAKAHEESRKLTELAIRENINLLLHRANEMNDLDLFSQAVQDSRDYLSAFPEDTNAVNIHWNLAITLDVKLKKSGEAYDEYMKISDLYWDTKHQKWSAENAIALAKEAATNADSLSKMGREEAMTISQLQNEIEQDDGLKSALLHQTVEMTEADKRLAAAYDNYIMLYPHEKETAIFLANAGALYYNRNQFQKALKYFNTLVRHFPGSEDVDYAKYRIMECYFGNRDFRSSEIVARRLQETAQTPEIAAKANKRLGESIFLNAEALADSGEHLKAGNEYVRVVVEVPGIKFADLALFNGALQYDEAHEYRRAVETYEYLVQNYSQSKYLFDAMNNQALDYGELNEFRNAAISYERLASAHTDTGRARDALFNSSIFYVRAEDWRSAIRVNKDYGKKYPDSPDADDLYFDIAGYHLKLDEIMEANQIYGEYAVKYPDSPRVVESFFRRGEYFRDNANPEKAKQEFSLAVSRSGELKSRGLETNEYFTAEALFALTQLKYDEFIRIEFKGTTPQISEAKRKKKELLLELVENYSNVARFGTIRLYEATYNIGSVYEEFAAAWARQELSDSDETRRAVALKEVNQAAANLYERSVKSFTDGVEVLARIANDYEAYLAKQDTTQTDSVAEKVAITGTGRVTVEDSTLYVAHRWIDRSKEKVSEIIYDIAELNHESVNSFLNAPVPEGLDAVSELEYRNQVLNRAVRPMIENIVTAHARNVRVAHEMNLQNKWVDMSKQRVVSTNNILPTEYQKMAYEALDLYSERNDAFQNLIKNNQDGVETSDQMATLIDYSNAFSRASIKLYQNTIVKGREQSIEDTFIEDTENRLMKNAYSLSTTMDSLATQVNLARKASEKLYKETDRIEFEDAIYVYEDNYFSFKEAKTTLLEEAYTISNEMGIANAWTNQVLFELVKAAPDKYKNLLDLQSEEMILVTEANWNTISRYFDDWTNPQFDDRGWSSAQVITAADTSAGDFIWCMQTDTIEVETMPVLAVYDSTQTDSKLNVFDQSEMHSDSTHSDSTQLAQQDSSRTPVVEKLQPIISYEYKQSPAKKAFYRKSFEIKGLPVSGQISLMVDDAYNLFLNGEYIAASKTDSSTWRQQSRHKLDDYIRMGTNVVAIEGIDTDGSGAGMRVVLNVTMLPEWAEKQKQFKFKTMNSEEKENLIFNKNIIVY